MNEGRKLRTGLLDAAFDFLAGGSQILTVEILEISRVFPGFDALAVQSPCNFQVLQSGSQPPTDWVGWQKLERGRLGPLADTSWRLEPTFTSLQ